MQSEAMEVEAAACGGGGGSEAGGGEDDGLWVPEEYMEASFAFQSWWILPYQSAGGASVAMSAVNPCLT